MENHADLNWVIHVDLGLGFLPRYMFMQRMDVDMLQPVYNTIAGIQSIIHLS